MNICDENLEICPFLNNENITEWKLKDFHQLREKCPSGKNCSCLDNIISYLENKENEK